VQQRCDKTHPQDGLPDRCSVDDVDRYLRNHLRLSEGDALFAQQQMLERGLPLHWRETEGPNAGQEGDIPRGMWGRELRLARDSEIRGGVDFATQKIRVPRGEVFVQELVPSVPRGTLELNMSARDVRMQPWPAPQAEQNVKPAERDLDTAIKARIAAGYHPGKGEQWDRFCDEVRKSIGAKESDRGYGDRSIKRRVKNLPNK
jgi:hypothetical protein